MSDNPRFLAALLLLVAGALMAGAGESLTVQIIGVIGVFCSVRVLVDFISEGP